MADDINAALGISASPASPASNLFASTERKDGESPSEFLEKVRARSCYAALRRLIAFGKILLGIAVVILTITCVAVGAEDNNKLQVLLGIGIGVFGAFFVKAYQEASLLLVDIADTLIEQNRKKS